MAKRKGKLIVLEGITRSGKSTQAKLVVMSIADLGYRVFRDAEPTNGPFGKVIRAVIEKRPKDAPCPEATIAAFALFANNTEIRERIVSVLRAIWQGETVSDLSMQLIFMADRAWHCVYVMSPRLNSGENVVLDRYMASTLAFGLGRGVGFGELVSWHHRILGGNFIIPELTVFVEIPSEVAVERMAKDGKVNDIFETEEGIKNTIKAYERALRFGYDSGRFGNIVYVDGNQSIPAVTEDVLREIRKVLDKK